MYYNVKSTAARITELRNLAGYTREIAASKLGIDSGHLRHIEKGIRGCSVDLFIRLAELYNVSLDYLICGKDVDGKVLKAELKEIISTLSDFYQSL